MTALENAWNWFWANIWKIIFLILMIKIFLN